MGMKIEEVREQLGIVSGLYNTFEELSKKLVTIQMRPAVLQSYLTDSLGLRVKTGEKELGTLAKKMLEEVTGLFEKGRGNDMVGVKGTAWAAFNAVAEFADYRRARGGDDANRTKSLLWGNGANMKQRAWDNALVLAK